MALAPATARTVHDGEHPKIRVASGGHTGRASLSRLGLAAPHPNGDVTLGRGAVADLPVLVGAPAPGGAVRSRSAGVVELTRFSGHLVTAGMVMPQGFR